MSSDGERIVVDTRYKGSDFVPLVIDKYGGNTFTGYNYPTFRYTDLSQKPFHKIQEAPEDPTIGRIFLTKGVKYRIFLSENSGIVSFKDNTDNEIFNVNSTDHYFSNDSYYQWLIPDNIGVGLYKAVYVDGANTYTTLIDIVDDITVSGSNNQKTFEIENHVFKTTFYGNTNDITIDNNLISVFQDALDKWGSVITSLNSNMSNPITADIELKQLPVSNALAGAMITSITQDPGDGKQYPITGSMEINKDQMHTLFYSYSQSGKSILYSVVLHELGHLLGIGPHWLSNGLRAPYYALTEDDSHGDTTSLLYIGEKGVAEYTKLLNSINGTSYSYLGIPIEDDFGTGSNTVHLDEGEHPVGAASPDSVERSFQIKDLYTNEIIPSSIATPVIYPGLDEELMTAKVEDHNSTSNGDMPLSRITVGLLEDLGYSVNYLNADEYLGVTVSDLQPAPEPEPESEPEPEPEPLFGWSKFTNDIQGTGNSQFGSSIAMTHSGQYLVVGAPNSDNSKGVVFVYERNQNKEWTSLSTRTINNTNNSAAPGVEGYSTSAAYSGSLSVGAFRMKFGSVVSVNEDATIVAVSSPDWAPPGEYGKGGAGIPGMVQVYKLQSDNTYSKIGQDLIGIQGDSATVSQRFGLSISLSSDGNRIAIGDRNFVGTSEINGATGISYSGRVLVYDYDESGDNWVSISSKYNPNKITTDENGNTILSDTSNTDNHIESDLTIEGTRAGPRAYDQFGYSVSISPTDKRIIAIGAPCVLACD